MLWLQHYSNNFSADKLVYKCKCADNNVDAHIFLLECLKKQFYRVLFRRCGMKLR